MWRPWKYRWTTHSLAVALLFGVALAGMNLLFYEAIARIPLGAAVSIEFVGPVAVAVTRGRGALPRMAAGIAFAGVVLIGGWGLDLSDPQARTGFLFALAAAGAWSLYIVVGSRISQTAPTGPALAVGTLVASMVFLIPLYPAVAATPWGWGMILALVGVGIFSSTIPYSIEALAFSRLSAALFALLTALLPATSAVVGALALGQIPTSAELVGLILISLAVWLASRTPVRTAEIPDHRA